MNDPSDARRAHAFPRRVPGPALPWVLAAASVALGAGGEPARLAARYERAGLAAGELWRLATAHCVHLGWAHTLMNLAALGVIAMLFGGVMRGRDWVLGTLLAAAAIDAGLYWLEPEVAWYVGLSGVLHGLVAVGAARLVAVQPALGAAVLAGLAVKLGLEALGGPSAWSAALVEGPVIAAAHVYGTAGASAYAAVIGIRRVRRGPL